MKLKKNVLKRIFTLFLTVSLILSLAACSGMPFFGRGDDGEDTGRRHSLSNESKDNDEEDREAADDLQGGSDTVETAQGVRMGFRDNIVYLEFFGKGMLDLAKEMESTVNRPHLGINFGEGEDPEYMESTYSISFSPTMILGNGSSINDYEYENDGLIQDSGVGYMSTGAPMIWCEQDENHIAMWFYAPGFEDAVSGLKYFVGLWDKENEFVGEKGGVSDIVGEYQDYATPTPELPDVFAMDGSGDDLYFTPMTPYYAVVRYDYPEVAIADHPEWRLVNPVHNEWWFAPFAWHYVPVTKMVLISYDSSGQVIALRTKYIYEDEQETILSRLCRNHSLKTNVGGPYGTEAEWEEWVFENFEAEPGSGSDGSINRLLHDGNVLYYCRDSVCMAYAGGDGYIQGADYETDLGKMIYLYEVFCDAGETREGTFSYETEEFGGGVHGINECSYTAYASFDLQAARDAAETASNSVTYDEGEITTEEEWFAVPIVDEVILNIFSRDEFEPYLDCTNNYGAGFTKLYLRLTTLGPGDAAEIFRRLDDAGFDHSMYEDVMDESTCFYGGEMQVPRHNGSLRLIVNTSINSDGDVIVYFTH